MKKKIILLISLLLLTSLFLTACGTDDEPTVAPDAEETMEPIEETIPEMPAEEPLIIGTTDSSESFDSAWVYSFHDWELIHQCADGLLNTVPGTAGTVEPALAESYTVSEDGTTYTFKLREGVVFPDGSPFNADAVMFTFDRIPKIAEVTTGDAAFLFTDYVASYEKIDDMTVSVTLAGAFAYGPQLIATNPWKIVNPATWTDTEDNTYNTTCGIGPYKIESFTEGEEAIFVANESYYGEQPKEAKVILRYFADSSTMALALQNSEIDIAWKSLAPADLIAMESVDGVVVESQGGTEARFLGFNVSAPPFDNPDVRQGLAMMINREELTELAWQGIKVPMWSVVPAGFFGQKDAFGETEDLAAGTALLAAAGYTADNPLEINFTYTPTHYGDTEPDVAAMVKEQFEASGVVKVTLNSLEWTAFKEAERACTLPAFLIGWYPDYLDPDNYVIPFLRSEMSWNGACYGNDDMDVLLASQGVELDETARADLLSQIQDMAVTESPFVPLAQGGLFVAFRDNISNVVLDPLSLFHYFLIEKN
ncbi:MAG: ABC transporter substrate-binding protein [Anaerolineales bacterium]|jgi:peptide/nickel transport system substrate-binding protein